MRTSRHLEKLEHFKAYNPAAAQLLELSRHEVEPAETLSRTQLIVTWICCLIAAGIMIETLFFKFTGAQESMYIFKRMGTEPWWRWGQGIWELLASVCLLTRRLKWAGGILGTGAMLAAVLSHVTWLGYSILGDHGLLFYMAIVSFLCCCTVLLIHRHEIPFVTPISYW
jgi:putative oxidoreductase